MFKNKDYLFFFPILLLLILFFINFEEITKREECSFYTSHAKIYKKFYPISSKINLFDNSKVIRKKAISLCKKEYLKDKNNSKKAFFYAYTLLADKQYEEGKKFLEISLKKNYHAAHLYFYLGNENGWFNIKKDLSEYHLLEAAKQDNYLAKFLLAQNLLLEGDKNKDKAAKKLLLEIDDFYAARVYLKILQFDNNKFDYKKILQLLNSIDQEISNNKSNYNDAVIANLYDEIGFKLNDIGYGRLSIEYSLKALKEARKIYDSGHVTNKFIKNSLEDPIFGYNYQTLAFSYNSAGDFIKAEEYYDRTLSIYENHPSYFDEFQNDFYPNLLNLISVNYNDLGKVERSIFFAKQSVKEFEKRNIFNNYSVMPYGNIGIYSSNLEEKKKYLLKFENLILKLNLKFSDYINAYSTLISLYLEEGQIDKAKKLLSRVQENEISSIYMKYLFRITSNEIIVYEKNYNTAIKNLIKIDQNLESDYKYLDFSTYYYIKKNILSDFEWINDLNKKNNKINNLKLKKSSKDLAKKIVFFLENLTEFSSNDIILIKEFNNFFYKFLKSNNEIDDLTFKIFQLLTISEIDLSSKDFKIRSALSKNQESIKDIQELKYIKKDFNKNNSKNFSKKLLQLEKDIEKKINNLNIRNFNTKLKLYNLENIQKNLKTDENLIYYAFNNEDQFFRLFISKSQKSLKFFPDNKIQNYIKEIRYSIDNPQYPAIKFDSVSASNLYNLILKDLSIPKKQTIYIKTNKYLHNIPLGILKEKSSNNNFLYEKYYFIYLASLDIFDSEQINKNTTINDKFFGLGNPIFKNRNNFKTNYVSYFSNRSLKKDFFLDQLPETEKEILLVRKNFLKKNTKILLRNNATEKNIKSIKLNSFDYLLFSTHGITYKDSGDSDLTGLALSTPDTKTNLDNGFLTSKEILALDLDSFIVVLSSCNSALDDKGLNNTYSGLVNSFIFAGSQNVISSHWYIDSHSTVKLMDNFFANLKNNNNISLALQNSINKFRKNNPKFDHPLFWGSFSITSNTRFTN